MRLRDLVKDPTSGFPDSMLSPQSVNYLNKPLPPIPQSLAYQAVADIVSGRLRTLKLRSGMKARDLLRSSASRYPDSVLDPQAVEVLNTPLPEGTTVERANAISAALLSWLPSQTLEAKAAATREAWHYAFKMLGLWLGWGGVAPLALLVALRWAWAGFEKKAA
jgi:hypothetical protein